MALVAPFLSVLYHIGLGPFLLLFNRNTVAKSTSSTLLHVNALLGVRPLFFQSFDSLSFTVSAWRATETAQGPFYLIHNTISALEWGYWQSTKKDSDEWEFLIPASLLLFPFPTNMLTIRFSIRFFPIGNPHKLCHYPWSQEKSGLLSLFSVSYCTRGFFPSTRLSFSRPSPSFFLSSKENEKKSLLVSSKKRILEELKKRHPRSSPPALSSPSSSSLLPFRFLLLSLPSLVCGAKKVTAQTTTGHDQHHFSLSNQTSSE